MERIKNFIRNITKKQVLAASVFLVAAIFAFFAAKYGEQMSKIEWIVLIVELVVVITITWGMAGHSVMKVLFGVSAAGLSLLIYIAQSYCDPMVVHTSSGNFALMSLVGFGVLYLGFEFLRSLQKEISGRLKKLNEINDNKNPWILVIPYGLFVGLFTWQIGEVLVPIINSLCVYSGKGL